MIRSRLFPLMCLATFVGCASTEPPKNEAKVTPKSLDELQTLVQAELTKHKVPGVGIALVTRDSVLWAGGVGKADLATGRSVTAETHFRAGSISKSFIALALLKLQDAGKIDLNAKVNDLLPDVQIDNPWVATRPVRVVHLLEHTTGFDDMHFNEMYNRRDPPDLPMKDVLAINPHSRRVRWEPGTRMAYSNPGYGVAGYLIGEVTGRPYEDYVKDSVLVPLGMPTSDFRLPASDFSSFAQGYKDTTGTPVGYAPIYLRPAGNLHTSPKELAQLVRMFLNDGKVGDRQFISSAALDRMERPATTVAAEHGMVNGYGLANYTTLDLPVIFHGHDGGIDGFISDYKYNRELGIGFVVLVNSVAAGEAFENIVGLVARYMLRDRVVLAPPAATVTTEQLAGFTGYYSDAAPRNELLGVTNGLAGGRTISVRHDTLFLAELRGTPKPLIPVTDSTFRMENEAGASIGFFTASDARSIMTGSGGYYERTSPWSHRIVLAGLGLAFGLMASSILAALVWIPRRLAKKIKAGSATAVRLLPLLSVLSFVGMGFTLVKAGLPALSSFTFGAASVTGLSLLFVLFGILGLLAAVQANPKEVGIGIKRYATLLSLANCGVAAFLAHWHLLGIMTWRY